MTKIYHIIHIYFLTTLNVWLKDLFLFFKYIAITFVEKEYNPGV